MVNPGVGRRLFGAEYFAESITEFVDRVQAVTKGDPPVDQLKAETLIRRVFGGADAESCGINAGEKYILQGLMAGSGVFVLEDRINAQEVVDVLRNALRSSI